MVPKSLVPVSDSTTVEKIISLSPYFITAMHLHIKNMCTSQSGVIMIN